jgi:hypothetical protein
MKKTMCVLLIILIFICTFIPITNAEELVSGSTVEYNWSLSDDGTLTISGNGEMNNYGKAPWNSFLNEIKTVIIKNGITKIGSNSFQDCKNLSKVSISNTVNEIGYGVFRNCNKLTSLTIPESVNTVDGSTFADCSGLKNIVVNENNNYFSSKNGNLYNKTKTILIKYAPAKTDKYYKNDNSLTEIGNNAFENAKYLEEAALTNSITIIGSYAFDNCKKLNKIKLPSNITIIPEAVFRYCSNLESITIPEKINHIKSWAFVGCTRLKSIILPKSIERIVGSVFYECNNLKNVYFEGTKQEWYQLVLNVSSNNSCLTDAKIHYNSKGPKPNTIVLKATTKSAKATSLKKSKKIIKPLSIKKAKGQVNVIKIKNGTTKSIYKKISVAKKTGAITLKKGKYLKKKYKIKLRISANGNDNYLPKTAYKIVVLIIK